MKVQFKYAFRTGLNARIAVFAVILLMDLVFITLGEMNRLSSAAHITAVSLGGVAIAVMMAVNIVGDIAIARYMFSAPGAYLHALTPVLRWKTLLAGLLAMALMDLLTTAVVIAGEIWLSFNLAGDNVWRIVWNAIQANSTDLMYGVCIILIMILGYLLVVTIILFCAAAKRSIFSNMPASGFLTFLLGCGCFYAVSLLQLIFAPFGSVYRYGLFITIMVGRGALPFFIPLILLEAAAVFALTSTLMERKMNI